MGGTNLWVGNLSLSYTEENLVSLFQNCGDITSVKLLGDKGDLGTAAALVNFRLPEATGSRTRHRTKPTGRQLPCRRRMNNEG